MSALNADNSTDAAMVRRELAVDLTGDAAEERDRYKHGGQDRAIATTGPDTSSMFARSLREDSSLIDLVLDRLDHHNRIVHDDADRENEGRTCSSC